MNNVTVGVGQPEIATLVAIGQSFVVDAQQVQDGGVEIVNGHRLVEGFKIRIREGGCGQNHSYDCCE